MQDVQVNTAHNITAVEAARKAANVGSGVTTGPTFTKIDNVQQGDVVTAQAVLSGIGAWILTASGNSGAIDITVSGADAACNWQVFLDGELLSSEADNAAPYEVTLAAPLPSGTYTVWAIAQDGSKTGYVEIEVA